MVGNHFPERSDEMIMINQDQDLGMQIGASH